MNTKSKAMQQCCIPNCKFISDAQHTALITVRQDWFSPIMKYIWNTISLKTDPSYSYLDTRLRSNVICSKHYQACCINDLTLDSTVYFPCLRFSVSKTATKTMHPISVDHKRWGLYQKNSNEEIEVSQQGSCPIEITKTCLLNIKKKISKPRRNNGWDHTYALTMQPFSSLTCYNKLKNSELKKEVEDVAVYKDKNGIPRKILVKKTDYFNTMPDSYFFHHFRLKKETVLVVFEQIKDKLALKKENIPPINLLLICLRYYAIGCHPSVLANFFDVDLTIVNKAVPHVTLLLCHLAKTSIHFPNTPAEIRQVQEKFYEKAAFPKVIAAVDCTHVKITMRSIPADENADDYKNQKGYLSLNVQAAVDASFRFLDVEALRPGSTPDAMVFNDSELRAKFESDELPDCFLLGDNSYASEKYLLTPLLKTHNKAEATYNDAHLKTRIVVQEGIGLWKRRFPILSCGCKRAVAFTRNMIFATAALHNIAIDVQDDLRAMEPRRNRGVSKGSEGDNIQVVEDSELSEGFFLRQKLINDYFARDSVFCDPLNLS